MKPVPVFEAKNRFSELLALVEAGQEVTITRRGIEVARLVSASPADAKAQRSAVTELFDQLKLMRTRIDLAGDLKAIARAGLD